MEIMVRHPVLEGGDSMVYAMDVLAPKTPSAQANFPTPSGGSIIHYEEGPNSEPLGTCFLFWGRVGVT